MLKKERSLYRSHNQLLEFTTVRFLQELMNIQ